MSTERFKDWIISRFEEPGPDVRRQFLYMLKFQPDVLKVIIGENIDGWKKAYAAITGDKASDSSSDEIQEIMDTLGERFTTEMDEITE